QYLQLGAEDDAFGVRRVEQGFFANAVACEQELSFLRIPKGDGKHSPEPAKTVLAEFFVQVNDRLGIRVRRKVMAAALQFTPQFGVVVDFAVQHDPEPAILVRNGLMAAGQVDDAESPEPEANAFATIDALVVRAAMDDGFVHAMDDFLRERLAALIFENAANSAHARCPSLRPRPGGVKQVRDKNCGITQACGSN